MRFSQNIFGEDCLKIEFSFSFLHKFCISLVNFSGVFKIIRIVEVSQKNYVLLNAIEVW